MNANLAHQAVSAAISGNWERALKINKILLEHDPEDIDALNRLAHAEAELGNLSAARKAANKVLKIDPFNSIATKSLARWKGLTKKETLRSTPSSGQTFLEEPGKTKIIQLINLGSLKVIASIDSGDEVTIQAHGHRVSICTLDARKYIGKLPDDMSGHLRNLIKHGNEYKAYVKSVCTEPPAVAVFIKETKKSSRLKDIPSFSSDWNEYVPLTNYKPG